MAEVDLGDDCIGERIDYGDVLVVPIGIQGFLWVGWNAYVRYKNLVFDGVIAHSVWTLVVVKLDWRRFQRIHVDGVHDVSFGIGSVDLVKVGSINDT